MLSDLCVLERDRCLRIRIAQNCHRFDLARLQAHRRVIGRLLAQLGAGRVDQGWLAAQHPLGAQFDIGPEMRFVHEEDLRPAVYHMALRLAPWIV